MSNAPYDWNELGPRRTLMHEGVTFLDETLRDGIQNPSVVDPSIEDKIELVHLMDELGIDYVNVGLPASSARNCADSEALCREISQSRLRIQPIAAGRTVVKDLEPIADIVQRTGVPVTVYAFVGSSEIRKLVESWSLEMLMDKTRQAVSFATRHGLTVCHVTEDTTRARPKTLRALWSAALDEGASRLCLADTVGYVTRTGVRNLVLFARTVADEAGVKMSLHPKDPPASIGTATTIAASHSTTRYGPSSTAWIASTAPRAEWASAPATRPWSSCS